MKASPGSEYLTGGGPGFRVGGAGSKICGDEGTLFIGIGFGSIFGKVILRP